GGSYAMARREILDRIQKYVDPFRITKGKRFRLNSIDPRDTRGLQLGKGEAAELLTRGTEWLAEEQDMLYAQDSWSLLLVLQAMDAAGKDGTIKHVMPFAYSDFRAGDLEKTYDQVGMSYLFYTNSLLGCRILAVANFKRKNFACKWAVPIPKRCVAAKRRCVPKTVIVMPRSSRGLIGANLSVKAL